MSDRTTKATVPRVAYGPAGTASDTAAVSGEIDNRLAQLEKLAGLLDSRFRIPGTGIPVGWDAIIGLVPGAGGLVTAGPAAYTLYQGYRLGARNRVLARMGANAAIDLAIGAVPLLGDIMDLFFKSHLRNIALLRREVGSRAQHRKQSGSG